MYVYSTCTVYYIHFIGSLAYTNADDQYSTRYYCILPHQIEDHLLRGTHPVPEETPGNGRGQVAMTQELHHPHVIEDVDKLHLGR